MEGHIYFKNRSRYVILLFPANFLHNKFMFHFSVPGAPSNVSFPDVSLTSARIIWDVPEDPNGEILAYKVEYNLDGSKAPPFSKEFPPSDRTYT